MKKLNRLFGLLLLMSIFINACDTTEDDVQPLTFEESVVIFQRFDIVGDNKSSSDRPLIIEIRSFSDDFKLQDQYYIDNIQYTDDGTYNDEIAGDGFYTSIKTYSQENLKSIPQKILLNKSDQFKFTQQLNEFIKEKYSIKSLKSTELIEVSCKVRLVTCPETDWWNSCWPLSSPCTCVEFYDCEVKIGI